ncbi:hypothetical protein YGAWVPHU_CDS0048 [Salmonella phage SeKF_13]
MLHSVLSSEQVLFKDFFLYSICYLSMSNYLLKAFKDNCKDALTPTSTREGQ